MADVAVVHLVRKANGIAPFERFVGTYRAHAAGCAHDLVLLFKGFPRGEPGQDYARVISGIAYQPLSLPDRGFDLLPYFAAARRFEYRYFCFLNSFSRIMASEWLAKLHRHATEADVGIVGATGSYQSFARTHEERASALRELAPAQRIRSRAAHIFSDPAPHMMLQRAGAWLLGALGAWKPARHFPPFPNYHVRTNAFMASRDTLLRVRLRPLLFKLAAFLLESGREGVTAQILRMGLRAVVVDRFGRAFEKEQWHLSNTFRQAQQEDLLVADNQTDAYALAEAARRALLSRAAWGEYARPG